jgi:uncharacterized LabA/DUF88 family protein
MAALVLADFDNFRSPKNYDELECELTLLKIKSAIKKIERFLENEDILVRLYGGWIDEKGKYTLRGQSLMRSTYHLRTRIGRKTVKPEIALGVIGSGRLINGLFLSNRKEQKMVDTLIAVDSLRANDFSELVFLSMDTDLLPPVLHVSETKKVILITSKCETIDSNLDALNSNKVLTFTTDGEIYA